MSNRFLVEQFRRWSADGEPLVLVTVVETAGSTYSKAGRQLLISPAQRYAGLVGGGCLEGDLLARAADVFRDGRPRQVTYDMREDADDLWGMGLGCRGLMRLLLQRLDAAGGWEPFTTLAEFMCAPHATSVELVVDTGDPACGNVSRLDTAPTATELDSTAARLCWTIQPWPRLLILGAGPDASPVCDMATALGWQVTVADHRQAYLDAGSFATADDCRLVTPEQLETQLPLAAYDAVCVMSHHLRSDAAYLQALSRHEFRYAGVLGPAARRESLLDELQLRDTAFGRQLRGPVGLSIGADTPQTIALALLAEIQGALSP